MARGEPVEVTPFEALAPFLALAVVAAAVWLVVLLWAVGRGLRRGIPRSCWFGHKWTQDPQSELWRCARCPAIQDPCRNCGGQHDPNAIVVCSVTRRAW